MLQTFKSVALHTGLTVGGAVVGSSLAGRRPKTGTFADSFDFTPVLTGILGSVAAPTAYHLAAPVVRGLAQGAGAVAVLSVIPASLGTAALFCGSALLGAAVEGAVTGNRNPGPYDFSALPGIFFGTLMGPPALALAQSAWACYRNG